MKEKYEPMTVEKATHRRALRMEFTAGFLIGIAEGVFFCWLASVI